MGRLGQRVDVDNIRYGRLWFVNRERSPANDVRVYPSAADVFIFIIEDNESNSQKGSVGMMS